MTTPLIPLPPLTREVVPLVGSECERNRRDPQASNLSMKTAILNRNPLR